MVSASLGKKGAKAEKGLESGLLGGLRGGQGPGIWAGTCLFGSGAEVPSALLSSWQHGAVRPLRPGNDWQASAIDAFFASGPELD